MKRNATLVLSFLTALWGFGGLMTVVTPESAYAKPPDWAPAHGYRRKHHDDNDDHDRRDRDEVDDWKKKLDDELEQKFPHYAEFRALDLNHDGRISLSEWEESQELFNRLDQNHDGILSRTEYARIDEERGFLSSLLAKVKEKVSGFWDWLF